MAKHMTSDTINGRTYELRMYEHPGKFEGEMQVAAFVDEHDDCGGDESFGEADTTGYYSILRGAYSAEDLPADADLTDDERAYLMAIAGTITFTNSVGFTHVEFYHTAEALEAAWAKVEEEIGELEGEGDDTDDEDDEEECDECGNVIPLPTEDDPDGGIVNKHHKKSCSLYPHDEDRPGIVTEAMRAEAAEQITELVNYDVAMLLNILPDSVIRHLSADRRESNKSGRIQS
jgi:hypothetical protein